MLAILKNAIFNRSLIDVALATCNCLLLLRCSCYADEAVGRQSQTMYASAALFVFSWCLYCSPHLKTVHHRCSEEGDGAIILPPSHAWIIISMLMVIGMTRRSLGLEGYHMLITVLTI